jgi:leucyl-tRNA synthetase
MHLMYTRFFTKAMRDCGIFAPTEAVARAMGRDTSQLFDEPMLALYNQGMILGEPRNGDLIVAEGAFEGGKLNARHIRVIDAPEDISRDGTPNRVVGEVVSRKELILNVMTPEGRSVVVDTDEQTTFAIPRVGPGATIEQIRYHLDVEKMSKSKGNVVAPDQLVAQYGADTVRGYLMFAFRWEQGGPWDSQGIQGVVRWLNDVWALVNGEPPRGSPDDKADRELRRKVHQTIKKVSDGLEQFGFNTAVAALMELKNALTDARRAANVSETAWDEAITQLLLLMAPFTPFIAEELWSRTGHPYSIHNQPWPAYDPAVAAEEEITLVIQVNGKIRDRIQVPAGIGEDDAIQAALASPAVQKHLDGKPPRKVIYIARNGMVSVVV